MGRRESARFLAGGSAPGGTLEGGQDEADDDGADRGEHDGADEPLDRAEAQLAAQPAADDTAEDTDHDRRQAAPRVAAAYEPAAERSRDVADEDPSDEPHVHAASVAWRGGPESAAQEGLDGTHERLRVGVVGGVASSLDDDDPAVGEPIVQRTDRRAEGGRRRTTQHLEHRDA